MGFDPPGTPIQIPAVWYLGSFVLLLSVTLSSTLLFEPPQSLFSVPRFLPRVHQAEVFGWWSTGILMATCFVMVMFLPDYRSYQAFLTSEVTGWFGAAVFLGILAGLLRHGLYPWSGFLFAVPCLIFLAFHQTERWYDLRHPQQGLFTVENMFTDRLDGVTELKLNLKEAKYLKTASPGLTKQLREAGVLQQVGPPGSDVYEPPALKLKLVRAPTSEFVYLPSEYLPAPAERSRLRIETILIGILALQPLPLWLLRWGLSWQARREETV